MKNPNSNCSNSLESQLLEPDNINAYSDLYDLFAATLYGVICESVSVADEANEILSEVFIQFKNDLPYKEEINEGLFICLIRITIKLISKYNYSLPTAFSK